LEARIAKAVEEATKGLKKKNDELLGKVKKAQDEAKSKTALDNDEYENYRKIKERIERDELLKLMAEGNSEEALAIATRKTKTEMEAVIAVEREEKARLAQEAATARAELDNTKISIAITQAAAPLVKPAYQSLIDKLARDSIKVVDGHPRVVDSEGDVVLAKNGKPLPISDYIESFRASYGDLFIASQGGGAGGSGAPKAGSGSKITVEAAGDLPMDQFMSARAKGLI